MFLIIGAIGAMMGAGVNQDTSTNSAQSVTSPKDEATFQRAVAEAKKLRESMRNPDSFKLNQALVMNDGAVCYDYRAQNGFGGMDAGQAILTPTGQFKTSESTGFSKLWNKECANKTGFDKAWEIGYAAGFHGMLDK